jgi:hypothetical protein
MNDPIKMKALQDVLKERSDGLPRDLENGAAAPSVDMTPVAQAIDRQTQAIHLLIEAISGFVKALSNQPPMKRRAMQIQHHDGTRSRVSEE